MPSPEINNKTFTYLDDNIVLGKTWDEHKSNLEAVFMKLREASLVPNPKKCKFFQKSLKYLRHFFSNFHSSDKERSSIYRCLRLPVNYVVSYK